MVARIYRHHGIAYIKFGGLYKLVEKDIRYQTKLRPIRRINLGKFCCLTPNGVLTLRVGFLSDGPSGPTFNTDNFIRGSFFHDAVYRGLREKAFDFQCPFPDGRAGWMKHYDLRLWGDRLIYTIIREDGMWLLRAWNVFNGLRIGGYWASKPKKKWSGAKKLAKLKASREFLPA